MRLFNLPTPKNQHYLNRYIALVQTATTQLLPIEVYTEKHHILPESMGGSNNKENIVIFTARQHFLAHWMLWKAYENKDMTHAFWGMCNQKNPHQQNRYNKINSKTYEILKVQRSKLVKQSNSDRWKNPEWAAMMREKLSKAASTPEERERRRLNSLNTNKKYKEQRSEKSKQRWQEEEYRTLVLEKIRENGKKRRKPIIIDGKEYACTKDVCAAFNICGSEVRRRIKSQTENFKGWAYKTA